MSTLYTLKKKNEAPELWSKHLIAKKKKIGKSENSDSDRFSFLGLQNYCR